MPPTFATIEGDAVAGDGIRLSQEPNGPGYFNGITPAALQGAPGQTVDLFISEGCSRNGGPRGNGIHCDRWSEFCYS